MTVKYTVKNIGKLDGEEVSQLYLGYPASAREPLKSLRGFERTMIKSGASVQVTLKLTKKDISIW